MSTATYQIPAENLAELAARMTRLERRADRLGLPAPSYRVIDRTEQVRNDPDTGYAWVHQWATVEINGTAPKLDGWTLDAVIVLAPEGQGANLVHVVDGPANPAWRTMGDQCDYCHIPNKGRKQLIVVRHPDGTRKIVGSTCVADFLGNADPHDVAAALSYAAALGEILSTEPGEDGGMFGPGPAGEYRLRLDHYLAVVAAEIRENGWKSVGYCRDYGGLPTKDAALRSIERPREDDPKVTADDRATAAAAIAWAQALDPDQNDYLGNCHAVGHRHTLGAREYGIAASIVATYQREAAQKAAEAAAPLSRHVGTVGKREVFSGLVTDTYVVESLYGTAVWVTVVDPDGNILKWKSSNTWGLDTGMKITGKATVKEHTEWKGIKQTVLTRWKWEEQEVA